jgi:hypothetical protein
MSDGSSSNTATSTAPVSDTTTSSTQEPNLTSPKDTNKTVPPVAEMSAAEKKKYKVKIDSEEMEVDEDELVRGYQLRKASDKKFAEANLARKQAEEFVRLLKTDPRKVLSHPSIGIDLKKFAEEYLVEDLQQEMLSPEQKKLKEYQAKLAKYEEQERTIKADQEKKAQEEVKKKYQEGYHKQITEALDTAALPKTEYTVERMIYYMSKALKNGYELEARDVVDLVRRDYIDDSKSLFSGLDAEALEQLLGSDIAKKMRQHDIKKVKQPHNNLQQPVAVKRNDSDEPKQPKKMSPEQWRAHIAKISGN